MNKITQKNKVKQIFFKNNPEKWLDNIDNVYKQSFKSKTCSYNFISSFKNKKAITLRK